MGRENKISCGRLITAVVVMAVVILIPIGTLLRMCMQHIPISQYGENIFGKHKLISLNTKISEVLSGGDYMESNEVMLGRDGWLFYKVTTDGTPLYDYMGINRFTDEELKTAVINIDDACETIYAHKLNKLYERYANKGTAFIPSEERPEGRIDMAVLTIPNKEQVYSEYMPRTIERVSDVSRLDQLTGYVLENKKRVLIMDRYVPLWSYTDVSDVFSRTYDRYPLYYKTDTHWTDVGAYLALTTVMDKLEEHDRNGYKFVTASDDEGEEGVDPGDKLDEVRFTEQPGFVGDLTRISATEDRYPDVSYILDGDSVPDRYRTGRKLLIVGDSFGDAMQHVAKYCYREVRFLDITDYTEEFEDILDEYDPDLVIIECVERYLPRLTTMDPAVNVGQ